jgi:hypothetical protein
MGSGAWPYYWINDSVEEISLILRDNVHVSIEEFRILDRYTIDGRIWAIVQRHPYMIRHHAMEYIMEPETLLLFRLISPNILASWNTNLTKNLGANDEFTISESLFIRPYY